MDKIVRFLENKYVKIFSVYLNPVLMGVIASSLGNWNPENDKYFWVRAIILIVLFFWYIFSAYMYSYYIQDQEQKAKENKIGNLCVENNELKQENERLKHEKEAYDKGMRELTACFYDSADSLNKVANNILTGKRKLETWSFKRVATTICDSVYNILCECCYPKDDFTVNIMLYDMAANGKKRKNITMIAHRGKYQNKPGRFEEKIYMCSNSTFYAVKLFESNKNDIRILISPEEVNERFVYMDDEHPTYCQYVGIPIVCSGKQMISLLQICTFNGCQIAESKEEISRLIAKYILPFSYYALLAYKIEKGLVNSFSIIERVEESKDGDGKQ